MIKSFARLDVCIFAIDKIDICTFLYQRIQAYYSQLCSLVGLYNTVVKYREAPFCNSNLFWTYIFALTFKLMQNSM